MTNGVLRIMSAVVAFTLPTIASSLENIQLPPGFSIEVYADVPGARSLALGDKGTVFVSNRNGHAVYAVVADGDTTRTIKLLKNLDTPNGIAYHDGDLYVARVDRITRYNDIESNLAKVPKGGV